MKLLSPRNPSAVLDRARADAQQIAADLVQLQAEREALLAGDDIAAIDQLDRKIENRQRSAAIHAERIVVLEALQRQHHQQEIEAGRSAAIAATKKKIAARVALAASVEAAAKKLADAVGELLKSENLVTEWPAELDRPTMMGGHHVLKTEVAYLLFHLDIPTAARPARFGSPSLTAAVENFGAALVAKMESASPVDQRSAA